MGLTLDTLRRLQLLSGTHVLVTSRGNGVSRLARVVALEPGGAWQEGANGSRAAARAPPPPLSRLCAGVAYLAPVLAFNLQLALHLRQYLDAAPSSVSLVPLKSVAAVHAARVALVREPADPADVLVGVPPQDTSDELEAALQQHFRTPRLLAQDDVFPVVCAAADASDDALLDSGRGRVLHFRVTSAEPQSGRLHSDSAHLLLDGSTVAAVPPLSSVLAFASAGSAGLQPSSAPVLAHPAAAQICALAAPLLHPSAALLRLRLAVLLKGPAGVGKRAAAAAAASALGMRLVTYNCHELAPSGGGCALATRLPICRACFDSRRRCALSSDSKTAAAVTSSFKAAAGYAPSVLLLRRFGALAGSSPGGAPDAGAVGAKAAPLLSRTLEHCIRQHGHASPPGADVAAGSSDDSSDDSGDEGDAHLDEGADDPAGGGAEGHARTWRHAKRTLKSKGAVLLLAAVESADTLPPDVRRCFTHEIEVLPPDEAVRAALLQVRRCL